MRKKIYLFLILAIFTFMFIPTNVLAKKCSEYTKIECDGKKDSETGEACFISTIDKKCTSDTEEAAKVRDNNRRTIDSEKTIPSAPIDSDDEYDNYEVNDDVSCGGLTFNKSVANVAYYFTLVFQILAPVALIIWGMIDLAKGVFAGKEEDMKKGQSAFVKRLITALILFFIITIVRILLNLLATDTIIDCFDCFVNGAKSCKSA